VTDSQCIARHTALRKCWGSATLDGNVWICANISRPPPGCGRLPLLNRIPKRQSPLRLDSYRDCQPESRALHQLMPEAQPVQERRQCPLAFGFTMSMSGARYGGIASLDQWRVSRRQNHRMTKEGAITHRRCTIMQPRRGPTWLEKTASAHLLMLGGCEGDLLESAET
jgi:hypothetical protein